MRKLFTRSTLAALALALGLTACGAPAVREPSLTEEEVLAAYEAAAQVYDWFDLASLPTAGDAVEVDGLPYRPVDAEGLTTYAQLEARVRACFAPALAEQILTASSNYRDIDGALYCAEGARGGNLYLYDTDAAARQESEQRWTVTLTFWARSWEWEQPDDTVGCSQTVLDYERQSDGEWRFTSFCPSDGLDLEADTVFSFTQEPSPDFSQAPYCDFTDLQLCCWLVDDYSGYLEGPADLLARRFLKNPEDAAAALSQLHPNWRERPARLVGQAAFWQNTAFTPEEQQAFLSALEGCAADGEAESAVLDWIRLGTETPEFY